MAEVTRKSGLMPRWQWVNHLLWLLPPMAVLLLVHLEARSWTLAGLASAWLLIAALMMPGLWQRARSRRSAFLAAYIHPHSPWFRRLRGGPLLACRQLLTALLLSLILVTGVIRLREDQFWWLLAAGLPLMVCLHMLIERMLHRHTTPGYLPELTQRLTLVLMLAILFTAFTGLALYAPQPDYTEVALRQALWHAMQGQQAETLGLEALLQAAAAKDALVAWFGQQYLPGVGSQVLLLGGWLVLLAANGLFVWSYLTLCMGTLTLAQRQGRLLPPGNGRGDQLGGRPGDKLGDKGRGKVSGKEPGAESRESNGTVAEKRTKTVNLS